MFPFLVDDNTGVSMYESADIVNYLLRTYGNGAEAPPFLLQSVGGQRSEPSLLPPHAQQAGAGGAVRAGDPVQAHQRREAGEKD
eukprot:767188-Hanusia_phi.AAC.2